MTVLKKVGAVTVTAAPVSLLARLELPAFVAAVVLAAVLAVAAAGLACWVISDDQRSERVVMLLIAARDACRAPDALSAAVGHSEVALENSRCRTR